MTLDEWFATAAADADRRHLPELTQLLGALHAATAALRMVEWNDDARGYAPAAPAPSSPPSASSTSDVTPSDASPRASS